MKAKIAKYTWDSVSVGGDASEVQRKIDGLKEEGWKDLSFCPNNRDCDCSADEIQGYRPRTKKELSEAQRFVAKQNRQEVTELKRLAKKYNFILVKNHCKKQKL